MVFAFAGAATATIIGGVLGILFGTREFPGRQWLLITAILPIAAPPAFWWIGAARLTSSFANTSGALGGALVGGMALVPVSLLLVFAALQQIPSNVYEAARLALPPIRRIFSVLLPLSWSALAGSFVLTLILLLGESEIPFLFGFRTLMTDVVTTFAQTFDVGRTLPLAIPLLVTVSAMGVVAGKPLMRTLLASGRGSQGIIRIQGSIILTICSAVPLLYLVLSLTGYARPIFADFARETLATRVNLSTIAVSVIEPVLAAWISLGLTLVCAYPARGAHTMPYMVWIGLLLFCVPAAIYAIGWIEVGQVFGGVTAPPVVAHISRAIALCALGFAVGYSRLPSSMESAAQLVRTSAIRRATVFVLPVIAASFIATSALIAALTYADRDVASLLLPPGASRLTLNLYLASANAPSSTIGVLAFAALAGAALVIVFAAAGPALLWRRRG
jgi:ABC-type Fe3+ transport system permease subunit